MFFTSTKNLDRPEHLQGDQLEILRQTGLEDQMHSEDMKGDYVQRL